MTISQRFDPRHNSLNFLRLVLATAVIVSHASPLGGFGHDPSIAGQALGTWAVMGFFAISGYLIASSRSHTGIGQFFFRRVLRIYPGFVVCLLAVAFVFAPLSIVFGTGASSGSYSLTSAVGYVTHNAFLKVERIGIANTLPHVPYGPSWNGSLWTLFYEFACYAVVGVLLSVAMRWRRPAVVAAFLVTAAGGAYGEHHAMPTVAADFFSLAPIFFAGALLYLFADRIPFDWRLGVLALVLLPVATELHAMQYLGAPLAAYAYLWLGIVLPFAKVGSRNDFSYGVYIYAFPVQQSLVLLHVNRHGLPLYIMVSIAVTAPFAMASWFFVERRALALKRRSAKASIARETVAEPASVMPMPRVVGEFDAGSTTSST
jgi:peptidoglycan/LPS O-acetylase OafA/YrhL